MYLLAMATSHSHEDESSNYKQWQNFPKLEIACQTQSSPQIILENVSNEQTHSFPPTLELGIMFSLQCQRSVEICGDVGISTPAMFVPLIFPKVVKRLHIFQIGPFLKQHRAQLVHSWLITNRQVEGGHSAVWFSIRICVTRPTSMYSELMW